MVDHYKQDKAVVMVPISESVRDGKVYCAVMLPIEWAGEIVDKHLLPREFIDYLKEKTKD